MPAVCLIHHPNDDDTAFVNAAVLPPLPALGFDRRFSLPEAENPTRRSRRALP